MKSIRKKATLQVRRYGGARYKGSMSLEAAIAVPVEKVSSLKTNRFPLSSVTKIMSLMCVPYFPQESVPKNVKEFVFRQLSFVRFQIISP